MMGDTLVDCGHQNFGEWWWYGYGAVVVHVCLASFVLI
jgi:hypothetical protein